MMQQVSHQPLNNQGESHPQAPEHAPQRILIISGLSGAGKTTVLKALEDQGYEAIDHVPLSLLGRLLKPAEDSEATGLNSPLAIGVDVRTRGFSVEALMRFVEAGRNDGSVSLQLVFLECEAEELRRRYSATRRRHPLALERPVNVAITEERQMLMPLQAYSDVTIDTTELNPGQLKLVLEGYFGLSKPIGMAIHVTSFSYRNGLPREADLVFDVRFLLNPFYNTNLKPLTGLDKVVGDFISGDPMFGAFFDSLTQLLDPLIIRYAEEGKSYLTIAVGCTGGRHRSVFVTEKLASRLRDAGRQVSIFHRELVDLILQTESTMTQER